MVTDTKIGITLLLKLKNMDLTHLQSSGEQSTATVQFWTVPGLRIAKSTRRRENDANGADLRFVHTVLWNSEADSLNCRNANLWAWRRLGCSQKRTRQSCRWGESLHQLPESMLGTVDWLPSISKRLTGTSSPNNSHTCWHQRERKTVIMLLIHTWTYNRSY